MVPCETCFQTVLEANNLERFKGRLYGDSLTKDIANEAALSLELCLPCEEISVVCSI